MKKYILGLLIVGLTSFGLSYANTETLTRTEGNPTNPYMKGNYNPNSITVYENIPINEFINNYNCNTITCTLGFNNCTIRRNGYQEIIQYEECGETINAGNYTLKDFGNDGFSSITINIGENQNKPSIVEGGISAFSGIIDRLGGIFGEFGPYIIYIAIACLGISLLFKALKYILGFTNNSTKNSIGGRQAMKERRTRRRRNRRLQRYIYRNERGRNGETYDQKYKKQYKNDMKFGSRGYNSRK